MIEIDAKLSHLNNYLIKTGKDTNKELDLISSKSAELIK